MSGKEIVLNVFNETVEMLSLNDSELRDYLAKRYNDNSIYHYSDIELKAALIGVIEGKKACIEWTLDFIVSKGY